MAGLQPYSALFNREKELYSKEKKKKRENKFNGLLLTE